MPSRTRSRTFSSPKATTFERTWYTESGATRSTSTMVYTPLKVTEKIEDVVIPNFHERSKNGEVFFNPMTRVRETHIHTPNSAVGYSDDGKLRTEGTAESVTRLKVPSITPPSSRATDMNAAKSIASTNALSKASSAEILLLATLGEVKETKEMLLSALHHLRNLDTLLRSYERLLSVYTSVHSRSKLKSTKQRYADLQKMYLEVESAWMQCRMGWRPFFYEVRSLYEAITQKERVYPKRQTFRGKSADVKYHIDDLIQWPSYGNVYFYKRSYDESITTRAGSLFQQRVHGWPDVYGLTKIPQTVWELSKLSWFVDYFFNVGEAIAACTPDTFWEPLGSWIVQTSVQVFNIQLTGLTQGGWTWSVTGGSRTIVIETKIRTPGTSVGVHFRPKMNWAKYIDSVAVCRQQLSKTLGLLRGTKKRYR